MEVVCPFNSERRSHRCVSYYEVVIGTLYGRGKPSRSIEGGGNGGGRPPIRERTYLKFLEEDANIYASHAISLAITRPVFDDIDRWITVWLLIHS